VATANEPPADQKQSRLRHVAVEAHGMAEEVHTVYELESKARGCKITGPCAWQFSFTPTDVSVIAPEPHVIYHYSLHTMFENDKTSEYHAFHLLCSVGPRWGPWGPPSCLTKP
jgi:hypothetical protein